MVARRTVRLPERLYERLRQSARQHYRSTNAEVVEAIRLYLDGVGARVKAEQGEKRPRR